MTEIIIDTLLDSIKIIPFLFIAFLIIETIEHNLSKTTQKIVSKAGKLGPFLGSLLGLVPQCGFSVIATNLYVTRIISLGTLIAIYLSTSDEMLPILLSKQVPIFFIIKILFVKFIIGLIAGYSIDFLFRKKTQKEKNRYALCDEEHCGCNHEHSLIKSSLIHTTKTILFLIIISFILNIIFTYLGEHYLSKIFLKDTIFAPFISSLIGLIPNCGASIMITELYLKGALSLGATVAGLLSSSGVAILILFKSNKNTNENLKILAMIYFIGVITGILLEGLTYLI